MTAYTVPEITNNIARVQFSDGTQTHIELSADMTEAQFDALVHLNIPPHLRTGNGTPSFLTEGSSRTAAEETQPPTPTWLQNRIDAYGTIESQIEYITENGLAAWQAQVATIKANNPKPSE